MNDLTKLLGQRWWSAIPPGSVLITPYLSIENDNVAIFQFNDIIFTVTLWEDNIIKIEQGNLVYQLKKNDDEL